MKKKAFVIGANQKALKYAQSDGNNIRTVLVDKHHYFHPNKDLNLLSGSQLITLLKEWLQDLEKQDTFLFYFAGHSFRNTQTNILYLVLETSTIGKKYTCLNAAELLVTIHACSAQNKIVILDSCESAAIQNVQLPNHRNLVIIAAAEPWEDVSEIQDLKAGFLSYYFHQVLLGKIPQALKYDFTLTINSFCDWINDKRKAFAQKRIPAIIQIGSQNKSTIVTDFGENIKLDTKQTLKEWKQLKQSEINLNQKLEQSDNMMKKLLESELKFEKKKLEKLNQQIEILMSDYLLSMDNVEKNGYESRIQDKKQEIETIFINIQEIKSKQNKIDKDEQYTILVIDDDEKFIERFRVAFRRDYEVIGAYTAQVGLRKLEQYNIDLVVLDVNLTDHSQSFEGLGVIHNIKSKYPQMPVVFASISENVLNTPRFDEIAKNNRAHGFFYKAELGLRNHVWKEEFNSIIETNQTL